MVFLYLGGLRFNAFVLVGNHIIEETLPFAVGEGVVVEFLQLHTEVVGALMSRNKKREVDESWI